MRAIACGYTEISPSKVPIEPPFLSVGRRHYSWHALELVILAMTAATVRSQRAPANWNVSRAATPMRAVMVDFPYKLGIDTGLVYGGKLTCVECNEGILYQVGRGSRQVKSQALASR